MLSLRHMLLTKSYSIYQSRYQDICFIIAISHLANHAVVENRNMRYYTVTKQNHNFDIVKMALETKNYC